MSSLYGAGSTSRLVLLPNSDDEDDGDVPHTTDDQDDSEPETTDPQPALPISPLPPSIVFLYLLSPYLRLGAINASNTEGTSLVYCLIGLSVAASLSAFCRQIWFLLARYLRKSSTEDILVYAFSPPHRKIRKYGLARYTFTVVSVLFRILLAAMYLRDAVDCALLLQLTDSLSTSRFNISILLSVILFVLSLPKSLASKSIVYTTALSVASYLAWLIAISHSYGANEHWLPKSFHRGVLWNEISSYAFACATTMTVPLSASLVARTHAPPPSRTTRARSFELLNVFSTLLAASLMFPLVIMTASPRAPASIAPQSDVILGLRIATLVFSIPSVVVSILSLPLYGAVHRRIHTDLALSILVAALVALSLVPPAVATVLDDVTLALAVSAAFLLPGLAHIAMHYFRRPLSIVVPQVPPSIPSTPRTSHAERSPSPSRDPLLERKERHLQRRRFSKRLLWDIAIWVALIPICVCAFVWAVGRLARRW